MGKLAGQDLTIFTTVVYDTDRLVDNPAGCHDLSEYTNSICIG